MSPFLFPTPSSRFKRSVSTRSWPSSVESTLDEFSYTIQFDPKTLASLSSQIQYEYHAPPNPIPGVILAGTHRFVLPSEAMHAPVCVTQIFDDCDRQTENGGLTIYREVETNTSLATQQPDGQRRLASNQRLNEPPLTNDYLLGTPYSSSYNTQQGAKNNDGLIYASQQFKRMLSGNRILAVILAQINPTPHPYALNRKGKKDQNSSNNNIHSLGLMIAEPSGGRTFFLPFNYTTAGQQTGRCGEESYCDCLGATSNSRLPLSFVRWLLCRKHLCITFDVKKFVLFLLQEFGIKPLCRWFDPLLSHWVMNPDQQLHQTCTLGSPSLIKSDIGINVTKQ